MQLDSLHRRLSAYLYLQDLLAGAAVLELGGEAKSAQFLVEQGARLVEHDADVVLAPEVDPGQLETVVARAKAALRPGGTLVVGGASRDASSPAAPAASSTGFSYYELSDGLEKHFAAVKMVGQARFCGATLVEYGVPDPEPVIDGRLVGKGERVEWYLAVCGEKPGRPRGYGVVQLPIAQVTGGERVVEKVVERVVEKPVEKIVEKFVDRPLPPREKGYQELQDALAQHAREMEAVRAELAERDAYVAELERERRAVDELRARAEEDSRRAELAESRERDLRRRLAESDGKLLRLAGGGALASHELPPPLEVPPSTDELNAQIAQLQAECEKLKEKEKDSRADAWKAMKARSEAEAAAAEVREDTVRKLKDARKLASVELTRAMEEATKKAVTLREELTRTERERKDLSKELQAARAEIEQLRATVEEERKSHPPRELARVREEDAAVLLAVRAQAERRIHDEEVARAAAEAHEHQVEERTDALRGRVMALERELAAATAALHNERARTERLSNDERHARVERVHVRQRLAEMEAQLRGESDRVLAIEEALRRAAVSDETPGG